RRDGDGPDQRVPAMVELNAGRVLPEGLLHRPRRDLLPEPALPGVDDRLPVEHRGEPVQCQTVSGFPAVGRGPEHERRLTEHVLAGRDLGALLSAPFCHLAHVPAPPAGPWPDSPSRSSLFWVGSVVRGGWSCTDIRGRPWSSVRGTSRVQSWLTAASIADSWVNPSFTKLTIVAASWDCTAAWSWASIARNGIPRVANHRLARSSGGMRTVSRDAAAFAHRCWSVPSPNLRRADVKLPAFSADPCSPSEKPTQDGGTPAAAASRDSALPWVTAKSSWAKSRPIAS